MRYGKPPFSFGVRAKILLASGILLLIPWLGYRSILNTDRALREGQQRALAYKVRTIVAALRDIPTLLERHAVELRDGRPAPPQLVPALQEPITLDGNIEDWIRQGADVRAYGGEQLIELHGAWDAKSLSFSHAIGTFENYLYAFFQVTDDHVVYCPLDVIRQDACDQLRISIAGDNARYIAAASAPGPLTVLRIPAGTEAQPPPDPDITGVWNKSEDGYTIEIRLRATAAGRPGFAIVDVDDPDTRQVTAVIATPSASGPVVAQTAFTATPQLQHFIDGIADPGTHIWIVDRDRRVVLSSIEPKTVATATKPLAEEEHGKTWQLLEGVVLQPISRLILGALDERVGNVPSPTLSKKEIERAVAKETDSDRLHAREGLTPFVSASAPLVVGDQVIGAVIAKQTTRVIADIRRHAAERVLIVTMAALALAAFAMFLYASRLVTRIQRLRRAAERAIDPVGRVRGPVSGADAADELGDLARSISEVLDRLAQYTGYLENMARRLGHELRTPIGVVRSSLDNLRMHKPSDEMLVYLERADDGLTRLNAILTRMSEATRLERIMKHSDREHFDLGKIAASCVGGYRGAYPGKEIRFAAPDIPIPVTGVPDLIAQMLDKLVENATDFGREGTPIEIELHDDGTSVALTVRNEGPPLPSEMADRLFESMVSVRAGKSGSSVHLGLGLYIVHLVAQFHYGRASAADRADGKGVEITVRLPRYVSDPA